MGFVVSPRSSTARFALFALAAVGCGSGHAAMPAVETPAAGSDESAAPSSLPPSAADALAVPSGQEVSLQFDAKGAQVYVCQADPAGAASWVLQGPEADLSDASGNPAGKHYAGPTWEALDGSKVMGEKLAAATPDPSAIPWLLLKASGHEGKGTFAAISFIQRKNTSGGVAPAGGCDASHAGETTRAPYHATYVFFSPSTP
jgi:hypothetical protein